MASVVLCKLPAATIAVPKWWTNRVMLAQLLRSPNRLPPRYERILRVRFHFCRFGSSKDAGQYRLLLCPRVCRRTCLDWDSTGGGVGVGMPER